jgi:excinuclease UvrABC ATPase subunit
MKTKTGLLMICLALFTGNVISAQTFKYIGVDKCKMCHNKPATGDQYGKWLKDPHSKALKSLSSQASLDYAKKNGIADPTKDPKCLKCHSTYDTVDPKLRSTILQSEGVSCESCHGPGSSYKSPAVMKNVAQAKKMGLVEPGEKVCLECHNKQNPFHKEFNFATFSAKIAHPNPMAKN